MTSDRKSDLDLLCTADGQEVPEMCWYRRLYKVHMISPMKSHWILPIADSTPNKVHGSLFQSIDLGHLWQ